MLPLVLSLATFASTLAGGLFVLRFRSRMHYMLAFTAGVLLGVVGFDILPEIFALTARRGLDVGGSMAALVIGFLFFHSLEKFVLVHHAHEANYAAHRHPRVGVFSGLALAGHSFMDGLSIGLGFQVSQTVGISVAIAVIAHDFCDGLNTVSLMLANRNSVARARAMLLLDAAAPVLGACLTLFVQFPPDTLPMFLGFFAGILLYIGAADILPEAHSQASPGTALVLIALTAFGAALMYVVGRLAQ